MKTPFLNLIRGLLIIMSFSLILDHLPIWGEILTNGTGIYSKNLAQYTFLPIIISVLLLNILSFYQFKLLLKFTYPFLIGSFLLFVSFSYLGLLNILYWAFPIFGDIDSLSEEALVKRIFFFKGILALFSLAILIRNYFLYKKELTIHMDETMCLNFKKFKLNKITFTYVSQFIIIICLFFTISL